MRYLGLSVCLFSFLTISELHAQVLAGTEAEALKSTSSPPAAGEVGPPNPNAPGGVDKTADQPIQQPVEKTADTNAVDEVLFNTDPPARLTLDKGTPLDLSKARAFNPWRSIGATLMVIGGLLAANLWLRKKRMGLPGGKGGQGRHITLLEKFFLDHRRSVLLFEVDGRRVLVGVSPDRIQTLDRYEGGKETTAPRDD